jgi:hypothetical protein
VISICIIRATVEINQSCIDRGKGRIRIELNRKSSYSAKKRLVGSIEKSERSIKGDKLLKKIGDLMFGAKKNIGSRIRCPRGITSIIESKTKRHIIATGSVIVHKELTDSITHVELAKTISIDICRIAINTVPDRNSSTDV